MRAATLADVPQVTALIEPSVRELQRADYTKAQLDAALGIVYAVDTQLIADGTYFVVEARDEIVASGGWSKRRTLFGGDAFAQRENGLLDPRTECAKIRAFFVHPDWARRGLGTKLLEACENSARAAGFRRFELGATLTGVRLFERFGYVALARVEVPLPAGETLPLVKMVKDTSAAECS
jgi:GNAT superfamily N-acetyltransferase